MQAQSPGHGCRCRACFGAHCLGHRFKDLGYEMRLIAVVTENSIQRSVAATRRGFKALWGWKSRARPGRPRIPSEVRNLTRQVSL